MATVSITSRDVARELARRYSTMTHEELDLLESILVPMKFLKNEMILREGETCTNIYWVVKGLVRQFYYKNGKEVTEYMATENSIVMCIESLFLEQPTHLQIKAIEPSILIAIPLGLCFGIYAALPQSVNLPSCDRSFIVRYLRSRSSCRRFMLICCALRVRRIVIISLSSVSRN